MERDSWLILYFLVILVLIFISFTQNTPEEQPKAAAETETSITIPLTPELIPASFSISDLTITPKEVTADSPVTIEALVTNTGELSGSCDVTLKIDETIEATEKVSLEGGASQRVTFTVVRSTARAYSININGQSSTFLVKSAILPATEDFMKGIHFNDWPFELDQPRPPIYGPLYYLPQANVSLIDLATTGANWISVIVGVYQETISSTNITSNQYATASDDALRQIIDLAHSLGIKVVLLPSVLLSNDPQHSSVEIGTAFTIETQWQEWFTSYREHINHYASFAQEASADMLYIGSKLPEATHREDDWRLIIKEVRERFKGPISYDSVFWGFPTREYKRIKWWDAVDFIAVDCWHSLTDKNNPTVAELKAGLIKTGYVADLEILSRQFNKPVIISQIGYDSLDGTNIDYFSTHSKGGPIDLQEQADCYQAVLEVIWGKSWLKGIFWWQWPAISASWLESPQGKPAEDILKSFYLS